MGLVLVCSSFRENTCKIASFLCSLDIFLINVIAFFFGNQISKWCSFEKMAIFDLLFPFFSHQGKDTKIPSISTYLTYIHVFCSPYCLCFALAFLQNLRIYHVWFLFGVTAGVDSFSRHFGAINK